MLPPIHQRLYSGFSVILFLLAGYSTIFTQPPSDPRFDHISIKNGLPGKYIHAVLQDNQGFIWIGSSYGLSRFDGYIIKNFRYDPNDSTVINNINTMFLDQNEGIWINTYADGLKYFNLKTEGFTHYRHEEGNSKSLSHNLGSVVIRDRAGTIWAGTVKGLNKLDSETSTFTRYKNIPQDSTSLHHDEINALFEDSKGRFWIGTGSGISIMDRKKGLFSRTISLRNGTLTRVPAGNSSVMCILEDANENFWIGTFGNGLIFWNSETNESTTFQNVPNTPNSISSNRLTSICQDGNSGLWIRTQDAGLSYLELATKNFTSIQHDPANPFSLSHNSENNHLTNIYVEYLVTENFPL